MINLNNPSVQKAYDIAMQAHKGQVDKTGHPYIEHPIRMASKADSDAEAIVALLHDVVEDTDITLIELSVHFSEYIIAAIDVLTKRKGETNKEYYERIWYNRLAVRVKMLDIFDNLSPRRFNLLPYKDRLRIVKKYLMGIEILTRV